MGIKQLDKFIKEYGVELKKWHISRLANKTIAIDTPGLIWRYLSASKKQLSMEYYHIQDRKIFTDFVVERIIRIDEMMGRYNINPIFVFDGNAPKEKGETHEKRAIPINKNKKDLDDNFSIENIEKDVRFEEGEIKMIFDDLKERKVNVMIDKTREAECFCAKLCKTGKADWILSYDSDSIAHLCPFMIRELKGEYVFVVALQTILRKLDLTKEQLQILCIFAGTDYNKNIYGIALKKAYIKLKDAEFNVEKMFKKLKKEGHDLSVLNYKRTYELFQSEKDEYFIKYDMDSHNNHDSNDSLISNVEKN